MTNHYRTGTDFERKTRHHLEAEGYEVIRSAGSKGKIDLVAFKTGAFLFVQCKLNGLCPPAERVEILRLARMGGATPLVAHRKPDGRKVTVGYRRLLGPGPKEFEPWYPDFYMGLGHVIDIEEF